MLVACDEEDDDMCDPAKHHITLLPVDPIEYQWQVLPTAVGGTQHAQASSFDGCGTQLGTSAITVSSLSPAVISATATSTEELALQARAVGEATLDITNTLGLEAMPIVEARPIASVTASNEEHGDPQLYYARGNLAIHLDDDTGLPLVDDGLSVVGDIPRAQQWDQLDLGSATPGDHTLGIVAGTATWNVTVHVVGAIDAVVAERDAITVPGEYSVDVCFFALAGGQEVGNAPWQFTVDRGFQDQSYIPNCASVGSETAQTVTVTATVLEHTATTSVTFMP